MSEMTCPKCHGAMRTYERNGVNIEQCTDCRGIFLDRGELEHLTSAEARWNGAPAAPSAPQASRPSEAYYEPKGKPAYYKRKKSFFEELFD
jgi:Zn-finger nucleic acid-binding protein